VVRCTSIAAQKVGLLTELIQNALQNDAEARKTGKSGAASLSVDVHKVTSVFNKLSKPVNLKDAEEEARQAVLHESDSDSDMIVTTDHENVSILDPGQCVTVL
jgi:biotin-(acetyl-CoA carboxylase) ligase